MRLSVIVVLAPEGAPDALASLRDQGQDLEVSAAEVVLIRGETSASWDRAIADLRDLVPVSEVRAGDPAPTLDEAVRGAVEAGHDVLLLAPGAFLTPGALRELSAVAGLDPMAGFVGPRFDEAGTALSAQDRRDVPNRRPRTRYLPDAPDTCLLIKRRMLVEFGPFDPAYGTRAGLVADLVARANRCGYRAVRANHAVATPWSNDPGEDAARLAADLARLAQRHPERDRAVARDRAAPERRAEDLLAGFRPDARGRLRVAFDGSHLWNKSGTSEAALRLVEHASAAWADCFAVEVICSPEIFRAQGFDRIPGLVRTPEPPASSPAVVVRIGQPFAPPDVAALRWAAPIEIVTFLDVIGLDCAYLDTDGFAKLWQATLDSADAAVFISAFTEAQVRSRFRVPEDLLTRTSLLSLDPADYAAASGECPLDEPPYILVVGNTYAHKFAVETAERIREARPDLPLVLLGADRGASGTFRSYASGELDEAFVERLYAGARCVVYPSHYEGFGFPLLHAVARRKPVVLRRMPVFAELQAALGLRANLHVADTTDDIVRLATDPTLAWVDEPLDPGLAQQGWARCAEDYRRVIEEALARFDPERLVRRLEVAAWVRDVADRDEELRAPQAALQEVKDALAHAEYKITHLDAAVAWWKGDADRFQAEAAHWVGEANRFEAESAARAAEAEQLRGAARAASERLRVRVGTLNVRGLAKLGNGLAARVVRALLRRDRAPPP